MSDRRRTTRPELRLAPQERRLAYGLALFSAVAFAVVWMPWEGGTNLAGFGLSAAYSAALAVIARQGHRLWTAFASILVGLFAQWGYLFVLGAGYIAFAFWLGWRAHRAVKRSLELDPDAVRGAATPMPPARGRTGAASPRKPTESGRITPKGTARRRSPKRSSRRR